MTTGGLVFVDIYEIDSYSGGTPIKFSKTNLGSDTEAITIFKYGITTSDTPGDDLREDIVGTYSTNQGSGSGGNGGLDLVKRLPSGNVECIKISNQEDDIITVGLGIIVCEI